MPIFSLQEITELQIQNINDGNFRSWPESATYGYYAGGGGNPAGPPPGYSTITKLDFSNESVGEPGISLPSVRLDSMAGVQNNSYGYFAGGGDGVTFFSSRITKFDFSNESVNDLANDLPSGIRFLAGTSSDSYGYFAGGAPPVDYSTITRIDFSNETVSNPGNDLPSGRSTLAGTSSDSYGYYGGGSSGSPPTQLSIISRIDFSNETLSNPGKNLPVETQGPGTTSSNFYGYFAGGYFSNSSNKTCKITRIDFSNETVSNIENDLTRTLVYAAGTSSSFYGYYAGNPTNDLVKLDFSSEVVTNTIHPELGRFNMGTIQGGSSILRSNGYRTFGYLCGGDSPSTPFNKNIYKFDYSSKTFSDSGQDAPVSHAKTHAASSHNYGYLIGGQINTSSSGSTSTRCFRVDFFSDISTELTSQLPFPRNRGGSFSNTEYAYFTGGGYNVPFTRSNFHKMDFSNESFSDLYITHAPSYCDSAAAVTDGVSYGYIVGGINPSQGSPTIAATYSTISKIDMSTDSVTKSPAGKNISHSVVVQNNIEGYYLYNNTHPPLVSYNTHKLNFSTGSFSETTAPDGAGNIGSKPGALSGNYYGYTTGGYYIGGGTPTPSNTIREFDYITYTEEVLPSPMPVRLEDQVGFSNSAVSTN